jgi:hypothetical protein
MKKIKAEHLKNIVTNWGDIEEKELNPTLRQCLAMANSMLGE